MTARLRYDYAEGRLTSEELDERTSAARHATMFGTSAGSWPTCRIRRHAAGRPGPAAAGAPWLARRRGPRFLPVLLLVLLFAVLAPGPGGWVLFAFFKLFLIFWLVTGLAAFVFARRFRRRMSQGGPGGNPTARLPARATAPALGVTAAYRAGPGCRPAGPPAAGSSGM